MQAGNINVKGRRPQVEINTKAGRHLTIPASDILRINGKQSLFSYVDRFLVSYNDAQSNFFKELDQGDEVVVAMIDGTTGAKQPIFSGLLNIVRIDFDNVKGAKVVTFDTASFAEELTRIKLEECEIHFKTGYGGVVKKLVEGRGPFDVTQVISDDSSGTAFFDKITVLEAMRTLAYVKGWCLGFEGRVITFAPCQQPLDSGVVLTDKDIISGSFEK